MRTIDRLVSFLENKGISVYAAESRLGMSGGTLRKCKNSDRDLGKASVERVLAGFPELNRHWLLTGSGPMLNPIEEPEAVPEDSSSPALLASLASELSKQREIIEKAQSQIDRILAIIEKQKI